MVNIYLISVISQPSMASSCSVHCYCARQHTYMHIRNRVYLVSDRIGVYRIPDNMRLGRSKQDLFQTFLTNEACRQAFQSALCDQYHMHRA